jgi:hypothetical protein
MIGHMSWPFLGVTYEWSPEWWQAWGAILQAVLSAAAVFAASRLQDQGFARRDLEVRNRRLEGVAAVARFVNGKIAGVAKQLTSGMSPAHALNVISEGSLTATNRAIREIEPATLSDVELITVFLRFEEAFNEFSRVAGEIRGAAERRKATGTAVNAISLFGDIEVVMFNAAAGVERRVAELVGRNPLL